MSEMHNNNKIILVGARDDGQAGVILDFVREFELYDVVGFIDDNMELQGKEVLGLPVLGTLDSFLSIPSEESMNFFICTGHNSYREKLHKKIIEHRGKLVNIVHPNSFISKSVQIGKGVFIGANVCIVHNTIIGDCTIINNATSIDHDNKIGDYVNISPGCHTSGRVIIKKGAFLGTGVTVIPDIVIHEDVIVGAGGVVIRNIDRHTKVVGNPTKLINK